MRRRTGAIGALIALTAIVPSADTAHAQDLDCRDFVFQEDAQHLLGTDPSDPHRLDEELGPDDGVACDELPRRGLTSSTTRPRTPAPTPTGPIAPTALPAEPAAPVAGTTAPASPPPASTTAATTAAAVTAAPTRGVRGGTGGSSDTGPSGWDVGIGVTFVTGALLAAAYLVRRRRP